MKSELVMIYMYTKLYNTLNAMHRLVGPGNYCYLISRRLKIPALFP